MDETVKEALAEQWFRHNIVRGEDSWSTPSFRLSSMEAAEWFADPIGGTNAISPFAVTRLTALSANRKAMASVIALHPQWSRYFQVVRLHVGLRIKWRMGKRYANWISQIQLPEMPLASIGGSTEGIRGFSLRLRWEEDEYRASVRDLIFFLQQQGTQPAKFLRKVIDKSWVGSTIQTILEGKQPRPPKWRRPNTPLIQREVIYSVKAGGVGPLISETVDRISGLTGEEGTSERPPKRQPPSRASPAAAHFPVAREQQRVKCMVHA